MTAARDRKEASKNLGIALTARYRALIEAQGDEAVVAASVELGQLFNDNIEFICWVLKEFGGVSQMPFQPTKKPRAAITLGTGQNP